MKGYPRDFLGLRGCSLLMVMIIADTAHEIK